VPNLRPTTNPPRRCALARLNVLTAAVLVVWGAAGCTRDGEGSTTDRREGRSADSADGALGLPTRKVPPYRVTQVPSPGSIRGTVDASGLPAPSATACGAAAAHSTSTIVWLDDIRAGLDVPADRKLERRLELTAARCRLEPRLQLALVGSTLNVHNDESVAHQVQLFRDGSEQPVYRIPFIFAGQVVPAQRPLSVPGVVEIRTTQDTALRSVVVVVDHPYATVVGADGQFAIDSVPPGRYKLMATNGAGVAEQQVEVTAAGAQPVSLRLTAK
jgi:hypothetical protein